MYDAVLEVSFACVLVVNSIRCKPLEFRAHIGDSHGDMDDVRMLHASAIEVGVAKIGKFGQYICNITLVKTSDLEGLDTAARNVPALAGLQIVPPKILTWDTIPKSCPSSI